MTGKSSLQFCTTLVLCFLTFSSLTNISKKGVFTEMYKTKIFLRPNINLTFRGSILVIDSSCTFKLSLH